MDTRLLFPGGSPVSTSPIPATKASRRWPARVALGLLVLTPPAAVGVAWSLWGEPGKAATGLWGAALGRVDSLAANVPGPLDRHDPRMLGSSYRGAGQPDELVAVLFTPEGQAGAGGDAIAWSPDGRWL